MTTTEFRDDGGASPAASGRGGAWLQRFKVSPLVAILIALLLVVILPPTLFLVEVSLHYSNPNGTLGAFTLDHYIELFTGRFFFPSLINTVIYAIGSAVIAIGLGIVQAMIVERTNTPGRQYMFLGSVISLGIPHVLYVVSWLLILGKSGPLNGVLTQIFDGASINVYSMWGMIVIEGVGFSPLTFLLMSAVLRSTDASFEEASLMSGANVFTTFRTITLPMGLPGILALLLLVFIRAFESFEVPALVGLAGNITVLTTNVFQSTRGAGQQNYGMAGAYAVCLVLAVIVLLFWYNRLSRNAQRYQTITGKGFRPRVIHLGRWRYFTAAILWLSFILVSALPLVMIVFTSLQPFYEGVTAESLTRFTLDNYRELKDMRSFHDSILNTLILGASTATAVVPVTALCAWLAVRRWPGAWLLDQIATLPLVFPAIVMSVAFLNVFVNLPIPLYGTLLSVIIASSTRYLPYGMRYSYAGVLQIHKELEDAASMAGAESRRVFLRIILPLLAPSLISSWLFIFLLAVQAVSLPLLLVGPGTEIVAVTLFDLWQNGQVTELASMGVAWVALMTCVSACFYFVTRRYQLSAR